MSYATAAAFRAALEARLNDAARVGGPPVGRARKVVAFTRLLARLRVAQPDGWVLKGGFALEIRVGSRARTTRDVDLDFAMTLDAASDTLIAAASIDLGDFFDFELERAGVADIGAGGGVRFRAQASVAGRLFETLLIDVGVGDDVPLPGDALVAPDLLGFAEISAPTVPTAPLGRHLAEKLHALTRRYGADQASSRPKDLIDILIISELAQSMPSACAARSAACSRSGLRIPFPRRCRRRPVVGAVRTRRWPMKSAWTRIRATGTRAPARSWRRSFAVTYRFDAGIQNRASGADRRDRRRRDSRITRGPIRGSRLRRTQTTSRSQRL